MNIPKNINAIIDRVLADAHRRRENAAYGGQHHDGGASRTEAEVRMFRHGLAGTMPPEWQLFADEIERETDPEWGEYQRLARKFAETKP